MLVGMAGALACAACSASSPVASMPKMLGLAGQPNLTSFLDVRFGDSLYRVQTRFPSGAIETAPYGADTYRINNIEVDSIRYKQVKYGNHTALQWLNLVSLIPSRTPKARYNTLLKRTSSRLSS